MGFRRKRGLNRGDAMNPSRVENRQRRIIRIEQESNFSTAQDQAIRPHAIELLGDFDKFGATIRFDIMTTQLLKNHRVDLQPILRIGHNRL